MTDARNPAFWIDANGGRYGIGRNTKENIAGSVKELMGRGQSTEEGYRK